MGEFQGPKSTYYYFFKEAGAGMAIADKSGILVVSNDRFNELIKSLSGTTVSANTTARLDSSFDFLPIHDAVRFSNLLSRLANGDEDRMDFKTPYHDKYNNIHWFKIRAWKMNIDPRVDLSSRGPFIGFILIDETVEIAAEEKLQEDMRIAEKTMEAKNRFLATMSHEIRTPIQTIIGMTELLEDTVLKEDQAEYAKQVKFSAEVLLSLVNDILDYSKIEAGRMELEHIAFSPSESIEQAVEMLFPEARKKGLALEVQIPQEDRIWIMGDPNKFRQVIINLIKNAVKFTGQGTITVSAVLSLGADSRNKSITVAVADTGIGISEEARERLFTTFMQADSSHTRRFGGTGLGLAISRNLVELMGGTIEMIPNKGGGSIFRFTIPVEETAPGEDHAVEDPEMAISIPGDFIVPAEVVPPTVEFAAESGEVLIVEDHPVNQKLIVMMMERLGVKTLCAGDGQEGLELALTHPVDLVFMDIQMPRLNGYEAAAELRRRGFTKPLIAVTAGALADERQHCMDSGFDDILPKPFKRPAIEAMYYKWAGKISPGTAVPAGTTVPTDTIVSEGTAIPTGTGVPAAENAVEETPSIFNWADLLDTFMNDEENVKPLLKHFIERTAGQIDSLPCLVQEEKWEEARRIAHTIKGSSMTMSGMELGKAAARLEKAYKQIDVQEMEAGFGSLKEAFERFRLASEVYLQS
jgi:signal transduction histidine kinase/CheY-like chemotaxis protein